MTVAEYWAEVRTQEKELSSKYGAGACLFVQPVHDPRKNSFAGQAVQVNIPTAAKLLISGTHTLATSEQIESYQDHQQRNLAISQMQELRNSGLSKIVLRSK